MFHRLHSRAGHYFVLGLTWAALCLPNLGGPSLWDIDEGNNAGASYEMAESGNYIVPTFNYRLRKDKPALLYWLQAGAYAAFGANEFAARLPSALAALAAVLATYEMGRRMFGKAAGLLAGLALASAVLFCGAAHFANPDSLLDACTVLTLLLFWCDYRRGIGGWFALTGVTTGLGMLAKGPVGLVLPTAVTVLFLLWQRQTRRLWDLRLLGAAAAFALVAAPWYVWVGLETKGEFLVGFFKEHNLQRALAARENHGGPFFYYALVLVAGFAPWSVFLGPGAWYAVRKLRQEEKGGGLRDEVRFLACWVAVYGLFFSAAKTKLPNYILPMYPAVALLTALFLDHWRRGLVRPPDWVVSACLGCLALMGAGVALGLLVAGGVVPLPALRGRVFPGLENWAALGGLLVLGAAAAWWCLRRQWRAGLIGTVAGTAVAFTGALAAGGAGPVDRCKAPRSLVRALPPDQAFRDVRVAAYQYFQPSLVFYCRREVYELQRERDVAEFLEGPLPSYLFVPADVWEHLRKKVGGSYRTVGRHYDLYDGRDVVVVTNEG